jgi:dTDP-4-dehydrorhamnose 3,5-epimerase
MKKVLVTGATGFLGGYVVEELRNNGYEVVAQGRKQEVLNELKKKYKIKTIKCDINNLDGMKLKVDYVIHAAALSTVWGRWDDFYNSNVKGTESVVNFCKNNKVKRLVYVSSPSIYSAKKDRFDIKENEVDTSNNLNYYIKSKIMAERIITELEDTLEWVIIRPRGLFGVGDTSIIPRLINANNKIGVPLFNNGKNIVDITCVENVALSLRLALESPKSNGNIYNITNGEPTEFKQILDSVFLNLNQEVHYRNMNVKVMYAVASVIEVFYKLFRIYKEPMITRYNIVTLGYSQTLNIDKAKADLNYIPKITLNEGILKYAEYEKRNNPN